MTLLAFSSGNAVVIGFAVVFGLVLLLPWTLDLIFARVFNEKGQAPRSTAGLSRASMAIGVLTVVGFALMYLIVAPPAALAGATLVRDIVVALTTTLAAITAFYFGTKAAERTSQDTNPEKLPSKEVIAEVARHNWSADERKALEKAAEQMTTTP